MLETNIRVVAPGSSLYISTRRARVEGPNITPDLLQRVCNTLRHRHGIAATPAPDAAPSLIIAGTQPAERLHLAAEDWELDVADAGDPTRRLTLDEPESEAVLLPLVERALLAQVARRTDLWTLDSPRIWYEAEPFCEEAGIAAYRRFELSTVLVQDVGVGVAVDIGTAFFTSRPLSYFLDERVHTNERQRRERWLEELLGRQEGQKGTLLYDNGRSRVKCYFEAPAPGLTCATTGSIRVRGRSYPSLIAYYRADNPDLVVSPEMAVVRVSFPSIRFPQPVAANRVRVRVMNDNVPHELGEIDKIAPAERRDLIEAFWDRLGRRPFGHIAPGLAEGFWCPPPERVIRLAPPPLLFGRGRRLDPPERETIEAYREHYRRRAQTIEVAGCHAAPPSMPRTLYCAYPRHIGEPVANNLAGDLAQALSTWTRHPIEAVTVPYDDVTDAIAQLRERDQGGMLVFVLNDEPTAYHEVAFQLDDWRVKRITERVLCRHYKQLREGAWDHRRREHSKTLGSSRWRGFVTQNALEVLQLIDAVPFRATDLGPYEAHLVIDVGYNRRHFALSLLVSRGEGQAPPFCLRTEVYPKADHQHESVNQVMLRDRIFDIIDQVVRRPAQALTSLLVLRDGRLCGQEGPAIDEAVVRLQDRGKLSPDARVDVVEIHKDTLKSLRLWETYADGSVDNALEGQAILLNDRSVLVTSTGAATLRQGTAEPYLIEGNGRCRSVVDAARATHLGAQLNWSNPRVAQRMHIALKRTDEDLKAHAARDIRRLR
ncbi:MAG: hypothetical protein IT305_19355 [Chloroflexi bacterium]|nr:hypothetical protein [Chloroflexota bacterium]